MKIWSNFVLVIVVTIVAMSVLNTLLKTVTERYREIGTMRCLGYTRRDMTSMIVWEGFILGALSSVLGLIISLIIIFAAQASHFTYKVGVFTTPIPLRIDFVPFDDLLIALGLCLVSSVGSLSSSQVGFAHGSARTLGFSLRPARNAA